MTPDEPGEPDGGGAAEELRGVRRIFLVALASALVAAGVTLAIQLTNQKPASPVVAVPPLPLTFSQAGFVDHTVHRVQAAYFGAGSRKGELKFTSTASPLYVVARCDMGKIEVVAGSLTSAQACTGKPVGVLALSQRGPATKFMVTVNEAQKARWAVGIYR